VNIPNSIVTLIAGIVLTLISLWYGQNHGLMPVAASEEAPLVDSLFNAMMTIATGLFILVQGIIVIAIIRFRRRRGDTSDGPPIDGNLSLEIVWTAIPTIMVLAIALYSFEIYNAMGGLDSAASGSGRNNPELAQKPGSAIAAPMPKERDGEDLAAGVGASPGREGSAADVVVDVKGMQYAWIFTYPDSGIVAGELHVPAGKDIKLNITASDVLHAFWIPQFRIKQDAIPGSTNQLRFHPQKIGDYPIICAELCGAYHGVMKTRIIVESPEEFQQWRQERIASSETDNNQLSMLAPSEKTPSDAEYASRYVEEKMGIDQQVLQQLH
jgi:cytochrome c oxidase subunit 2